MKKKNGFTLIELLAVIVILAIIALIAVPRIIEILNKARLSATEDSAMGIVEAAEAYIANFMLQNQGAIPSEELEFSCGSNGCNLQNDLNDYNLENLDKLEFKGKKPTSGNIYINENGLVSLRLELGSFCAYKSYSSNEINVIDGPCYENLWYTKREYPFTQYGITVDYDYDTQIYTVNGTATASDNLLNMTNIVNYKFNLNDKYIVKMFYISGNVTEKGGFGVVKMDFFGSNNNQNFNGVQKQIVNHYVSTQDISSSYIIEDVVAQNAIGYKCEIGNWDGSVTFDNYKIKVYFGKEGPEEYIPNIKDIK